MRTFVESHAELSGDVSFCLTKRNPREKPAKSDAILNRFGSWVLKNDSRFERKPSNLSATKSLFSILDKQFFVYGNGTNNLQAD